MCCVFVFVFDVRCELGDEVPFDRAPSWSVWCFGFWCCWSACEWFSSPRHRHRFGFIHLSVVNEKLVVFAKNSPSTGCPLWRVLRLQLIVNDGTKYYSSVCSRSRVGSADPTRSLSDSTTRPWFWHLIIFVRLWSVSQPTLIMSISVWIVKIE